MGQKFSALFIINVDTVGVSQVFSSTSFMFKVLFFKVFLLYVLAQKLLYSTCRYYKNRVCLLSPSLIGYLICFLGSHWSDISAPLGL
jgi:hypothetical protein